MGFVSKFKDFVGIPPEEDYDDAVTDNGAEESYVAPHSAAKNKVVDMKSKAQLQVVLVKPETFDSATEIADHLNAKRTVVLNLEMTPKDVSRRLVDFLCGVAYANGGEIRKVANCTFIITPFNVEMSGEVMDQLEDTGVFIQ